MSAWDDNTIRRVPFDTTLLLMTVLLTGLGLTMVFSASAVLAEARLGDSLYYLKRSGLYALIGFILMTVVMRIPYTNWKRLIYPLLLLSVLFGALTLFSGFGLSVGGARRWLKLGPFAFQPSELAKIAIILFMAYSLEKKQEKMETFAVGIAPQVAITGVLILLVLAGKDLGSAVVMGSIVFLMLFLGGANLKHLLFLFLSTLPFLWFLIAREGYRVERILSFINPWEDRLGKGFQIIQSLLAFSEGGFSGKGLGAGQQKLFYLPEAHTDFIFSVLGEELGLLGVLAIIGLFLVLVFRGIRIGKMAPDLFGKFLALGIVTLMGVQSLLNMGVVMGLLPTKGLVLPFIGYGGSSLVTSLVAVGILLNVSTYQQSDTPAFGGGQWTTDNGQRTEKERPRTTDNGQRTNYGEKRSVVRGPWSTVPLLRSVVRGPWSVVS